MVQDPGFSKLTLPKTLFLLPKLYIYKICRNTSSRLEKDRLPDKLLPNSKQGPGIVGLRMCKFQWDLYRKKKAGAWTQLATPPAGAPV